jgi:hypothetical protein
VDGNSRGQFDDGVVDALPVQDVLRPPRLTRNDLNRFFRFKVTLTQW